MTAFQYTINEDGMTVEQLLRERWQAGKKTVHELRMAKGVKDEERMPIDWRTPLPLGTQLVIEPPHIASSYTSGNGDRLDVLYEDAHVLAAVKPAGIATHPDGPGDTGTFMNDVIAYVRAQGGDYAEHVHRLDKGTAGIILIAKHLIAKAMFDRMLEQGDITRMYTAEVDGYVRRPKGIIQNPIGRDRHHPSKRRVSPSGQAALTRFRVIQRADDSTIVEALLETGRTHQIRVHMAHIGHPVKGDLLYGGSETPDGEYRLTATLITFVHPFTEEPVTIELRNI